MTNQFLSHPSRIALAAAVSLLSIITGCSAPSLRSITISPSSGSVVLTSKGQTAQFTATGTYAQGSHPPTTQDITHTVSWASSTPSVATIDSSGLATAVAAGSTKITASAQGASGALSDSSTVSVTIITRDLSSLAILPGSQTVAVLGETAQFTAVGTYNAAPTSQDLTTQSTWSSSDSHVATINSATGLATAVGAGTTTITATAHTASGGSVVAIANMTVTTSSATGLTSINIIPNSQTLSVVGQTAKFVAIGTYTGVIPTSQDLTAQATWSSSSPGVATIVSTGTSAGVANAVGVGSTTITAIAPSSNGSVIVGTATVTVSSASVSGLTQISIIPGSQTVRSPGESSQYIAIGTFVGTTPATQDITNSPNLTWHSSDVKVATINSAGLATEGFVGTTAITALWTQPGSPAISGAATFTSTEDSSGPVSLPTLTVYKVGVSATTTSSNVIASPVLTNCGTGAQCTGFYPLGTVVTLTITPATTSFGGWSSNCKPVTGNPYACTVTMNNNQSVGAIFN